MFGCLGRLGCLLVLALCAAVAWFTHDRWYPQAARAAWRRAGRGRCGVAEMGAAHAGGVGARAACRRETLQKNGPVYVDVAAGDLAAYALDPALRGLSHDSVSAEALARDERLSVRAMVDIADLADAKSLGPLSSMLSGKQEITVRGQLEVLSPGHAQFRVDRIALKDLKLPAPLIESSLPDSHAKDRDANTPRTRFRCACRRTRRRARHQRACRPVQDGSMSRRLLVVDDEQGIRAALTQLLEYEGYEVHVGGIGRRRRRGVRPVQTAARVSRREDGRDGRPRDTEASARARSITLVVMISGHATIQNAVEATQLGAYDILESRSTPIAFSSRCATRQHASIWPRKTPGSRRPSSRGTRSSASRSRSAR